MLDRVALLWLGIGIIAGAVLFHTELSEALYSIPPTNAWRTIGVDSNATWSATSDENVTAVSYSDTLYLISDGSIGFNITSYP